MSTARKRKTRRTITHEQAAWYDMVYRCTKPDHPRYKDYGAKGIKVYAGWLGAGGREAFTSYMGQRPSPKHVLGRIDMAGDYTPDNVTWMTRGEARLAQKNTVKVDTADGPVAIATLAEQVGKDPRTVRRRVSEAGWSPEDALNRKWATYRRLTAEQAVDIFRRANDGQSCAALAEEFGVSLNLIYEIKCGKKWAKATGAVLGKAPENAGAGHVNGAAERYVRIVCNMPIRLTPKPGYDSVCLVSDGLAVRQMRRKTWIAMQCGQLSTGAQS